MHAQRGAPRSFFGHRRRHACAPGASARSPLAVPAGAPRSPVCPLSPLPAPAPAALPAAPVSCLLNNGNTALSGACDGSIKLWRLQDGQLVDTKTEALPCVITALQYVGPLLVRGGGRRPPPGGGARAAAAPRPPRPRAPPPPPPPACTLACKPGPAPTCARPAPGGPVLCGAFQVAVGTDVGSVSILDISTHRLLAVQRLSCGPGPVTCLAAHVPDGILSGVGWVATSTASCLPAAFLSRSYLHLLERHQVHWRAGRRAPGCRWGGGEATPIDARCAPGCMRRRRHQVRPPPRPRRRRRAAVARRPALEGRWGAAGSRAGRAAAGGRVGARLAAGLWSHAPGRWALSSAAARALACMPGGGGCGCAMV
jgi:hypothetical protein